MAKSQFLFVTGDKELDAKLAAMTPQLEKKFIRSAARKGGKRVEQEFRRIVKAEAYDTGAYEKSTKIKALKRKKNRIGVSLVVDTDKYFARYAALHGGKKPTPRKGETRPHYVPATIEFGDLNHEPVRPQRRALYDNAPVYIEYFKSDLRQFIKDQKASTTLAKSTGYTGKNFKR